MGSRLVPEAEADVATHVIAFEVLSMGSGTKGNPPRGQIRIDAVLRGSLTCVVREAAFPSTEDSFYVIRGGGQAALEKWRAVPLDGPAVGTRLVAVVHVYEDKLSVDLRDSWPDTPARRERVLMGPPK